MEHCFTTENSRIDDLSTALPSECREYGVSPEPLSCNSQTPEPVSTSPRVIARPSPNCPAQLPNWWPPYLCAYVSMPTTGVPPPRTSASPLSNPKREPISSDHKRSFGLGAGVGRTRDQQAFGTWRLGPPTCSSPGVSDKNRVSQLRSDQLAHERFSGFSHFNLC